MRAYLLRVCSSALPSWPVLLVMVVASAIISVTAAGPSATGSTLQRSVLAALGGAACFGIVALAWLIVLRHLRGITLIASTLIAVIVAGACRGALVQLLLVDFGLTSTSPSYAALRVISSAVTMPAIMVLTAGMVATVRAYRHTAGALVVEQVRLTALLDDSARGIEERQRAAFERVQANLQSRVRDLDTQSTPQVVAALEALVGNVVRPLSHTLARDVPAWELPDTPPARLGWTSVFAAPDIRFAFRPTAFVAIMVVIALPAALLVFDPRQGLLILGVGAGALWLTLALGRRLFDRWIPGSPAGVWSAIVGWYFLAGFAGFGAVRLAEQDAPGQGALSVSGLVAVTLIGPAFATILMVGERMRESTAALEQTTSRLMWHLARINTERWEQNGRLSRALHGPVQSLLYAAMLRLRQGVDHGTVDPAFIDNLSIELSQAIVQAMSPSGPGEHLDAEGVFRDISLTWRGVAEVTQRIAPEIADALRDDPVCARLLVDLAGEAVSNAVRHGGALCIDIQVTRPSLDVIQLLVTDDGLIPGSLELGLGTHLLRSCTIDYRLDHEPTRLTAQLPYETELIHA